MALVLLAGSAVACDSGSTRTGEEPDNRELADGSEPPPVTLDMAQLVGHVEIAQPAGELDGGSLSARFVRLAAPQEHARLIADTLPALDGCQVTRQAPSTGEDVFADGEGASRRIGAGETITFTSPAGTWLTLTRDADFEIEYINELDLPLPIPERLTFDLSGDEFPAFTDIPIRKVAPVEQAAGTSEGVGRDDVIRWAAPTIAAGANESLFIRLTLLDVTDEGIVTTVDCLTGDDGEFALPSATRETLDDTFSATSTLARLSVNAFSRQDALLLVTSQ